MCSPEWHSTDVTISTNRARIASFCAPQAIQHQTLNDALRAVSLLRDRGALAATASAQGRILGVSDPLLTTASPSPSAGVAHAQLIRCRNDSAADPTRRKDRKDSASRCVQENRQRPRATWSPMRPPAVAAHSECALLVQFDLHRVLLELLTFCLRLTTCDWHIAAA